jgi:hypothetical protein
MINTGHNQRSETIRSYHDAKFIICNSCLWCASWLAGDNFFQRCPICMGEKLELIPIGRTEAYLIVKLDNSVAMEFWNVKK